MDTISTIAVSIQNPLLTALDLFFDNVFIYAGLILLLVFLAEKREEKRRKLIVSLILTFILATIIKVVLAHQRPCFGQLDCPEDYSFPSLHAAIAFTLMTGFLNKKSFPLFLFFALVVCFTRLNLGVHIFQDIVVALPLALVSYYLTDILWKTPKRKPYGSRS
ncbi:Undecaprenyl-diphosphatase [Candidatus Bilamarchaeum dharawalense]|uniref:Undecaprenyl-diphosphatase n=1 Tax=Candidatus Bilamarchaeum dharawalense TaxID=2885759 RepID=A0A5E4LQW8_9ARCH|nr:Undecaprenyl-diphosphatase [Candidatus Bilamarchaeum dharawalense]